MIVVRRPLIAVLAILLIFAAQISAAAPDFPALTGRVVDNADYLSSSTEKQLVALLAAHEKATTNQVVVVTLKNLQGYSIEEYGYQLGREWGIGQKDRNNGVLLIVSKAERKVRIEVGYGLEGVLTDALSSNIIHTEILPAFKKRQFDTGIEKGAHSVIQTLGGEYVAKTPQRQSNRAKLLILLLIFFFVGFWPLATMLLPASVVGRGYRGGHYGGRGGFGGGGFGSGGFGGGGGGFGGGGASGGW